MATAVPPQTRQLYSDDKWKLSKLGNSAARSRGGGSSCQRKCAFARKCAALVKEQRARFYIIRRCVIMLVCWSDS